MGSWYLSIGMSLLLILVGLSIHWSVVLLGCLLPFLPMLSFLVSRNAARRQSERDGGAGSNDDGGRDG
jgi:hypothetical protein